MLKNKNLVYGFVTASVLLAAVGIMVLTHLVSPYKPTPAKYSMLHARVIPPEGGETEFADMRAAWDALRAPHHAGGVDSPLNKAAPLVPLLVTSDPGLDPGAPS